MLDVVQQVWNCVGYGIMIGLCIWCLAFIGMNIPHISRRSGSMIIYLGFGAICILKEKHRKVATYYNAREFKIGGKFVVFQILRWVI